MDAIEIRDVKLGELIHAYYQVHQDWPSNETFEKMQALIEQALRIVNNEH